jgi:Ca2+-binding RTX toxin-like protein
MKKALPILLAVLVACTVGVAHASERSLTVLLAGDASDNVFRISLDSEGRNYLIESNAPLEVGRDLCSHPAADPDALECEAAAIGGFEVNAGPGADRVVLGATVNVPATIRGGGGADTLVGGAAADKLLGNAGPDKLVGRGGDDWLYGGPGRDRLYGGPGDDRLAGGPGTDRLAGGPGKNVELP